MKPFTQDTFHPRGNCWQFAVACILEVGPHELPAQFDQQNDPEAGGESLWSLHYNNALGAYLKKHHGLAYVELHQPPEVLAHLRAVGYHTILGRTVRSAGQNDGWHAVVGKDGVQVWDPHPSRAGLIEEIRWAFLTPFPKLWERAWRDVPCVCPKCTAEATS